MTPSTSTGQRIRTFSHDSLRFDVLDDGPVDGPAVVLLHGFPERASHWDAVASRLHAQGLRTLVPDQRGYSPGARTRGRRSYRMSHLVGDTLALVERYGAPVHLVGHDWGAAVAWAAAAARPDLVRTLTTVSVPHPSAFARSLLGSGQALRSWYVLVFQAPGLVEAFARNAPDVLERFLRRAGMSEAEVAGFRRDIVEYGALPGGLGWYRALPLDASPAPGTVRVPTTHLWTDGDSALSRRGAELTAPYELRILKGVTHWVPTQAPDQLAAAILDRISAAG